MEICWWQWRHQRISLNGVAARKSWLWRSEASASCGISGISALAKAGRRHCSWRRHHNTAQIGGVAASSAGVISVIISENRSAAASWLISGGIVS
jgi:hypothetical protein